MSGNEPQDDPIMSEFKAFMNQLATNLDTILKPNGFVLLVFPEKEQRANYISNRSREDMISVMKEFIARNEGKTLHPAPETPQ